MRCRTAFFGLLFFVSLVLSPSLPASGAEGSYLPPGTNNAIPYKRESPVDGAAVIKSFVILFVLLGAVTAAAFFFKKSEFAKKLGVSEFKHIDLIELRRLSPKLTVYLIRVHGKHYLLTQAGENVSVVEHPGEKTIQNQNND